MSVIRTFLTKCVFQSCYVHFQHFEVERENDTRNELISSQVETLLFHLIFLQEVLSSLPNVDIALQRSFATKSNDLMLVMYVSSLIRSVLALHSLIVNKVGHHDQRFCTIHVSETVLEKFWGRMLKLLLSIFLSSVAVFVGVIGMNHASHHWNSPA